MNMIIGYGMSGVYAGILLAYAFLASYSWNKRSSGDFDAAEAISGGNIALGFRRFGLQLGLGIAFLGVLSGGSNPSFWVDVFNSFGYGALAIGFMWVSITVIDKVILPHIDNNQQIANNNIAVGIVEFGTLVMTGILAFASIYGDGGSWLSSVGYFILGQITVVALVFATEKLTKCNLLEKIANGEIATAVYLAGKIIAIGLIMMSAIKGNGTAEELSVVAAIFDFAIAAFIGMVFLYIAEWLIDLLIITKTDIHEMLEKNNIAAMLQLSGVKLGMALVLSIAIL